MPKYKVDKKYYKDETGVISEYEDVSIERNIYDSNGAPTVETFRVSEMLPSPSWLPSTVGAYEKQKAADRQRWEAAVKKMAETKPEGEVKHTDPFGGRPVPIGLTAAQLETFVKG